MSNHSKLSPTGAIASKTFGVNTNKVFNDMLSVGKWPGEIQIKRIARIEVSHGHIMDGFTVTYEMIDGSQQKLIHGQTRAGYSDVIDIGEGQILSGITGGTGFVDKLFGTNNLFSFYFLVTDLVDRKLISYGPYGSKASANPTSFSAGGRILAFSGSQSPGDHGANYLQSLAIFREAPNQLLLPDGIYNIIPYVDLDTVIYTEGHVEPIIGADPTNEPDQIWELVSKIDGLYYIRNMKHDTWLVWNLSYKGQSLLTKAEPVSWALTLAPRDVGTENQKETYHISVPGTTLEIKYDTRRNKLILDDFKTNNNADQLWLLQPTQSSFWDDDTRDR